MSERSPRPVALVTGSRSGIGRALAAHLVAQEYSVVGCSRSPAEWTLDGYAHTVCDVREDVQVAALVNDIARTHGRLDAVINCAGAASMNHALLTPGSAVDVLLSTNVRGTFVVSREAAKLMRRAKFGRIVNISSVAVQLRLAGQSAYVAAKAAVERLSQVLAVEFADFGITVNVVSAPPVDTAMIRGVPKEKIERLLGQMAIPRLGTFEDIANVVDFFLRPESDAVTGQIIVLGGVPPG